MSCIRLSNCNLGPNTCRELQGNRTEMKIMHKHACLLDLIIMTPLCSNGEVGSLRPWIFMLLVFYSKPPSAASLQNPHGTPASENYCTLSKLSIINPPL